jgi:putative flippase GtrA
VSRAALLVQLSRFSAVGVSNTAVTLIAYGLALRAGVGYLPAGAGAYALGGLNGFLLNRAWTFGDRGRVLPAGARYAVVQAICLAADVVLLWLAVHVAGLPHLPAQLAAAAPVTLLGFALSGVWVFRSRQAGSRMEIRSASPSKPVLANDRAT